MLGSSSQKKIWKHTAVRDKSLEDSFMKTTNGGSNRDNYASNASFGNKARLSKSVVGLNRTAKGAMTARSNGSGRHQKSLGRQS